MWPRPLPNHWVLGSTIGVDVGGTKILAGLKEGLRYAREEEQILLMLALVFVVLALIGVVVGELEPDAITEQAVGSEIVP